MQIIMSLSRSEAVLENIGSSAVLDRDVPSQVEIIHEVSDERDAYVQFTYEWVRPAGEFGPIFSKDGYWWNGDDPIPFSDLTVWVR